MNQPQVHLMVSTYLTDKNLGTYYGEKISITQSKVDQFLSSIHSYSKLNFNSQSFYMSYDNNYAWATRMISNRIRELFPNSLIYQSRLENFDAWKLAASKIPKETEQILLTTNHDHIYARESSEDFEDFITNLNIFGKRFIGQVTHWPEYIGSWDISFYKMSKNMKGSFFYLDSSAVGTSIISYDLFQEWWRKDFTEGSIFIRPDNPFGPSIFFEPCPTFIPSTELFRHLDGYGHISVKSASASAVRSCCKFENGQIRHSDWKYGGYLFKKSGKDLPSLPSRKQMNNFTQIANLVLLASSHNVSIRNLRRLFQEYKFNYAKYFLVLLFLDGSFLKKFAISRIRLFSRVPRYIFRMLTGRNRRFRKHVES